MAATESLIGHPGAETGTIDAIVLAGGFGTRLAPRVPGRPKPLAPVGGRPFLALQLDWLALQPVRRALITAHYLADQVDAFVRAYHGRPLPLETVREDEPLGTGGAVANVLAGRTLSRPVLVINGDTYFGFDIGPALEQHRTSGLPATVVVARVGDATRYGRVRVRDGRITAFEGASGGSGPGLVSCGAYLLDLDRLGELPPPPFSIERDLFPSLAAGGRLGAWVAENEAAFFDIGMPESYDSFRARVASNGDRERIDRVIVRDNADLSEVMRSMQLSGRGICLVCDAAGHALGVLTDGDVRRALLAGARMEEKALEHMNRDFVSVNVATPKEQTLKLLDSRIRVIPVLDDENRLVDVVGTGYAPSRVRETYARAKAPVRISLSGGGTDFTDYFTRFGGVCLTATTSKHSHVVLRKRQDRRAIIVSHDLKTRIQAEDLDDLVYDGQLDLIKAGARVMQPDFGFELHVSCDFPPSSGLGGSASLLTAVIGAFNEFRDDDRLDSYAIAEHAYEAERVELGIAGGWQDQYATAFGGFNFIEFTSDRNIVTPLRLPMTTMRELEERLVLCYTGRSHGGRAVQEGNRTRRNADPSSLKIAEEFKSIANAMKSNLLRGALDGFGELLDQGWQLKRRYSDDASDTHLDRIYQSAKAAGAEGGRLLGTGGGGFFLFCVPPFSRLDVSDALSALDLRMESVVFDHQGVQSWTVRE